jgi:membrane-bound lytic murein transglycosylase MltF
VKLAALERADGHGQAIIKQARRRALILICSTDRFPGRARRRARAGRNAPQAGDDRMISHNIPLRPIVVLGALLAAFSTACRNAPAPAAAPPANTTPTSQPAAPPPADVKSDEAKSDDQGSGDLVPDDLEQIQALQKWTGDFDGMVQRRIIRVLTVYSKTTFFVDKGTQMGLVPDAFRLFEDDLNKRLKTGNLRIHVVIIPVAADELIPALLDGRGDIVAAGKVVTAWRKEKVDFANPTRTGISTIVVTGPGVAPLKSLDDLSGRDVYIRASDVSSKNVDQFNAQLAAKGKAPVKITAAPEVLADEDLLEMVNAGLVQQTIVDDYVGEFWKQIFPNITLNTSVAVRTDADSAMMVRKNSPKLLAELNGFLAKYPNGSLERNVLFQKYLKNVKFAKSATASEDMIRFRKTVDFMRKYSEQYKLDYLLMAAQGYQESGLDQDKKSAVGAMGVMQVMPATGADMKVGDISKIEPNIHAGIKYIRFMMDTFYADEPMDQLNKGLFTFASYNAGPGRIRQLRERAKKRGLDPNKWFNNVEVIAAETIGRETVQYVSNIYKYYLAYKILAERQDQRTKAKSGL